jgi:hypothetical protein
MKSILVTTALLSTLLATTASAQYGLLENFEGTDRFGAGLNLTDGINFNYGGASGGGEGPGAEFAGGRGYGWGTGAAMSDGFGIQVRAAAVNDGPDVLDLTASVNGLTSTGYTIAVRDVDADGVGGADAFEFIVEDDNVPPGQEIFTLSGLTLNTYQVFTFNPGDGVAGPDGLPNRARFKQFIVRASTLAGTGANLNVDNIGFTGNLVPTSYDIEDFESFVLGDLATGGRAGSTTNFGGAVEAFGFGSNITGATVVDTGGGDNGLSVSMDGIQAGFFFELGPVTGSQADVSATDGLTLLIGADDAAQDVQIIVETIDAPGFGDRCQTIVTPGTTVAPLTIPFSSLTCGAQGFNPAAVHRVTILPATADAGTPGITITVNNLAFTTSSSVADWAHFE